MSRILQYSLKSSLLQFRYDAFRVQNEIVRPSFPRHGYIHKYKYSSTVPESLEKMIHKLDTNAKRYGRLNLKDVENALDLVKSSHDITVTQSLMMIRCCGSLLNREAPETRTKLAMHAWKTFQKKGVEMDIGHYNALLRVFVENEHRCAPADMLAEMEKKGLKPNRVTCQRLITKYCQSGDIAGATTILQYMHNHNMPINVNVFNALVLGHSQANDMLSAEGILATMNEAGVDATSETYTLLICGYIKQKNMEKVKEWMQYCEKKEVIFSNQDYFDMMFAYAVNGYEKEIADMLRKMPKNFGYAQDAVAFVCKLILAGKPEIAYQVLKSMPRNTSAEGQLLPVGNFFIAQMVSANQPVDLLIKYCNELASENLNPNALLVALGNSLRTGKESIALTLMKLLKENKVPIRRHYFWPLLINRGKMKDFAGVLDLLTIMNQEYGLEPDSETIRYYVIPYMLAVPHLDVGKILMDLKSCGVSISTSVCSMVVTLLEQKKTKKAAEIVEGFEAFYPMNLIQPPLIVSFLATHDVDSFVKILKAVAVSLHWRNSKSRDQEQTEEQENGQKVKDFREQVATIVLGAVRGLRNEEQAVLLTEKIIQQMFVNGIGVSSTGAEAIEKQLNGRLPSHSKELLQKLTTEEYATPPAVSRSEKLSYYSLSEKSLERLQEIRAAKGQTTDGIKRQLFMTYARDKDLDKMLALKSELEAEDQFTEGSCAKLIETYTLLDKVDEALDLYKKWCEKNPAFTLSQIKTLRLALGLVQCEQYDVAIQFLMKRNEATDVGKEGEENVFANSISWKILNHLANAGQAEKVNQFFDLLVSGNFMEIHTMGLSPLVKVHAKKEDWKSALNEFARIVEKYKITPWKSELTKHFIETEDTESLQKITDLSTTIHGERNSLCDLALLFVECERPSPAKKIFLTTGVRLTRDRVNIACKKYVSDGLKGALHTLLEVTQGMPFINRLDIFDSLLSVCEAVDDTEQALALWTQMQDEDVPPTDGFLLRLAGLLKKNNVDVPFVVPKPKSTETLSKGEQPATSAFESNVKMLIDSGDLDKALERIKLKRRSKAERSRLIEACLSAGRYADAKDIVNTQFSSTRELPVRKVFKYFLGTAAKEGDLDVFEHFADKITEELRMGLSFDNLWASAYKCANRVDELLTKLESQLEASQTDDELKSYSKTFPRGTILGIGIGKPEYSARIEALIQNAVKKCKDSIMPNVLWMLYLNQKNYDKANDVWEKYLKNHDGFMFIGSTLSQIRVTKDVELASKLASFFETDSGPIPKPYHVVNGTLIHAYVDNNMIEEALKRVEHILTKIPVSELGRHYLIRLKNACEERNIPFPYEIPVESERNAAKSDSSGSDSD